MKLKTIVFRTRLILINNDNKKSIIRTIYNTSRGYILKIATLHTERLDKVNQSFN